MHTLVLTQFINFIKSRYALAFTEQNTTQLTLAINNRCKALGIDSPAAYLDRLTTQKDEEARFINAITTGETCFFRYPESYQLFLNQFSEEALLTSASPIYRPIKILNIGCSTGEEPYTIAILLHQSGHLGSVPIQINAFDLNPQSIQHAKNRLYSQNALRNTNPLVKQLYFQERPNKQFELSQEVAQQVNFFSMNVFDLPNSPLIQHYDFIFCMNVMIYFDGDTITRLIPIIKQLMNERSRLFLAPTDSIMPINEQFQVNRTTQGFWYSLAQPKHKQHQAQLNTHALKDFTQHTTSTPAQSTFIPPQLKEDRPKATNKSDTLSPSTNFFKLGLQAYEQKAYDQAEQYYQQGIEQQQHPTECHLGLAKLYADQGRSVQAAELAELVLSATQHDEAYLLLGTLNLQAGNYHEAKEHFKQCLNLNANNHEARNFLSILNESPEAL
ncbi:CheR family methyltransferase [Litoribrevibacter euphylliae]|uniref:protein-glutamate O-methyltransferase n=1 Tax=Litoribrevibacter euphylliae TaxID=1834034 RepID=A0ABV7HE97_9GAMM